MELIKSACRILTFSHRLERVRPRLYRIAYAWTRHPEFADDLTQDVLYRALQKRHHLRDIDALEAWLVRILHRRWCDLLRQKYPDAELDEVVDDPAKTPERMHSNHELVRNVRDAVSSLPVGQRAVVTLVDLEGFSYRTVADLLELPIGTVMSRLCRARRRLKESLAGLAESELDLAVVNDRPQRHLRRVV